MTLGNLLTDPHSSPPAELDGTCVTAPLVSDALSLASLARPLCSGPASSPLNEVVSEAFVRFFVETVGHYSLFLTAGEREERALQREAFRKAVSSKSLRRFLEVFMETQMFRGFIQERELRRQDAKGQGVPPMLGPRPLGVPSRLWLMSRETGPGPGHRLTRAALRPPPEHVHLCP